jgi:hypothetical protein
MQGWFYPQSAETKNCAFPEKAKFASSKPTFGDWISIMSLTSIGSDA